MGFVISTPPDDVAFSIALGVLLLSVVLAPIVKTWFYRVRADRAWKMIEDDKEVDVTKYSFFAEAFGDRGRWDMARVVAIMLALFHVSTWGLELSLDLAIRTDGPVDLLNRPPPVVLGRRLTVPNGTVTHWIVMAVRSDTVDEQGALGNFEGTLFNGQAKATYRVGDSIIRGDTLFASWSTDPANSPSDLFYDNDSGHPTVEKVDCSTLSARSGEIHVGTDNGQRQAWGVATECDYGPKLINASSADESPPTIILNGADGNVYLVVEEESSYPSFLYSVWSPSETSHSIAADLNHVFYVASTTRLVEAIVTGLASGIVSGGGCVNLLSEFSLVNRTYDFPVGRTRVSLFGEYPVSSFVDTLDQVEPIVAGVQVSNVGTGCALVLIGVTAVAFIGCLCYPARKPFDVYDRDTLIRTVALPTGEGSDGKPKALKIFVNLAENGRFRMVVSDDGVYRGCDGLRKRFLRDHDDSEPEEEAPTRGISRTWSLPAAALHRTLSDDTDQELLDVSRRTNASHHRPTTFVQLVASPVPALSRGKSIMRGFALANLADLPVSPPARSVNMGRAGRAAGAKTPVLVKPVESKKCKNEELVDATLQCELDKIDVNVSVKVDAEVPADGDTDMQRKSNGNVEATTDDDEEPVILMALRCDAGTEPTGSTDAEAPDEV